MEVLGSGREEGGREAVEHHACAETAGQALVKRGGN